MPPTSITFGSGEYNLISVFGNKKLAIVNKKETNIDGNLENYINEMISKRNEAKKNKDFALADQIRDELKEKGILIKDTREGTIYEIVK